MACIAAFALLFGACSGSAWAEDKTVTINATVRSQDQITQAEYDAGVTSGDTVSYVINGAYGDDGIENGFSSAPTTITIGTEYNTASISVSGTYALYSFPSNTNPGDAIVTLNAESIEISGSIAGIYSIGSFGSSTVTLDAASNTITANETTGIAVHSYGSGSTVEVSGATTLTAATGAEAREGGMIIFTTGSDVTANAKTVARADGSGSEIHFYYGLSNEGYDSIIRAFNDGAITVNASGTGIVNFTGTTDMSAPPDDEWNTYTDGTINMTLGNGSVWNMTGDSTATTLNNSGQLYMTADNNGFSTLTLSSLYGNGTIYMDIAEDASGIVSSDVIYVTDNFTDTQYVTLVYSGELTNAIEGTALLYANGGDGTLIAAPTEGTLYWYRYNLASQNSDDPNYNTEWVITNYEVVENLPAPDPDDPDGDDSGSGDVGTGGDSGSGGRTPVETTTVNTIMSASSLNYHSWMMQNAKLLQRLSDLRQGANNGINGAWFRISGSKLTMGGDHGFENKYMQYEAGYDKIVEQTSKYTMYGGIALTFTDGESAYNRGDGDNESKAVSLYFTQINKGGSYLDLVFKLGRWENDFTAYDTSYNRIEGKTENTGMSVSAELGKKFALGNRGFYIEPQAQLTYGHFDGDSYTVTRGNEQVNVHADGIHSLVGRAGFNLGWDIDPRANVYLKANVLYEFLGDYGITMSDDSGRVYKSGDYSDTWFLYGLGASFKLGKPNSGNFLHFDVERSTGGDLDQEWFYNVGFRFEM